MNILGLPFWQVMDVSETTHDMQIEAKCEVQPSACPHCGCVANLYRHGVKHQIARITSAVSTRKPFQSRTCFPQENPNSQEKYE